MAAQHNAQHNAPLPDGLEISGYRIVKKIAAGGFSIVYLAEDSAGLAVAIKEYLPDSLTRRPAGQLKPVIAAEKTEMYRIGQGIGQYRASEHCARAEFFSCQ